VLHTRSMATDDLVVHTKYCIDSFAIVLLAMLEIKPDVLDVFAAALPEIEKVGRMMMMRMMLISCC
jgi:hypothetical protein